MSRSIDEHMADDSQYRDETEAIIERFKKRMEEAPTPEAREEIRKEMCQAFNQAGYARYDRAKAQVLKDVR